MSWFIDPEIKPILLQILADGDSWGGELIEKLQVRTNIKMLKGLTYSVLRELESDGLLTSYEGEPLPERGGRPRRYYHLTEKAKAGR